MLKGYKYRKKLRRKDSCLKQRKSFQRSNKTKIGEWVYYSWLTSINDDIDQKGWFTMYC